MNETQSQEGSRMMEDRFAVDDFQDSNESKMWLRQKGSVKEFNAFFDDATSNVQLPERYLVMTYVAGLKREIADSVRLFQPKTMYEALSLARVQEISLQWRAKKAEQARKDLEYQSEKKASLLVKNEVEEFSANQEVVADQEQEVSMPSSEVSLSLQDSVSIVDVLENHKNADQVVRTSVTKAPTSIVDVPVQEVSLLAEETGEVKTSSGDFDLGSSTSDLVSDFHNLKTWKWPKTREGVDESLCFDTCGSFLIASHAEPSCAALSVSTFSMPIPILPSSACSLTDVFVSFPPLIYLPSSLFMSTPAALVEKNSGASKKNMLEGAEWQDLECTYMQEVLFEKSKEQLVCIYFGSATVSLGGLQLDGILFSLQKHLIIISDIFVGLEDSSNQNSPITLHLGLVSPLGQDLNRLLAFLLYSPTRVLLQIWFKGELIKMLIGSGFLQCTVDDNLGSVTYENGSKEQKHSGPRIVGLTFYS